MTNSKFDDDEQIVVTATDQDNSENGILGGANDLGKVPLKFDNEPTVPLEDTKFELLLELSGRGSSQGRLGADIVMVLDISGSMGGEKLNEMKSALQFVIRKLSSFDRLSVVVFATNAERKCPLRQIRPEAREEIEFMVQNLKAAGNTNISGGLRLAIRVLDERRFSEGRSKAIMLMSDGMQNEGGDAGQIVVKHIPVFTFGFGGDGEYDSKVLNAIARNSNGGTFSYANRGGLNAAFSQCLGGLLTVLVQDVKLFIAPLTEVVNRRKKEKVTTIIKKVYAGNYQQSTDDDTGVVTVEFGNLYLNEVRKVLLDLLLPAVSRNADTDALEISTSYRGESNKTIKSSPSIFRVSRSNTEPETMKPDTTKAEIARIEAVEMMKVARDLADEGKFDDALNTAVKSRNMLEDVDLQKPNSVIETLKQELDEMTKFLQSGETYNAKGRSFTLCSETCHMRQRFASRGGNDTIRPYSTPRMDTYLEQAKAFNKDSTAPIPTAAEDEKQEVAKDPLAGIAPSISHYLEIAIDALQNLNKIINQKPPA